MSDILWFDDANGATVQLVGGKGANLSLLTRAGFDVPPGFTITAGAYSAFLHNSGLDAKIGKVLADLNYKDTAALDRGTETIRQMICATELPKALAEQISSAYARLGKDPYVAVRSSGVAEDMEGASFAGLHDTYLDIRSVASLLDAVRRCWASLWTARATSYRQTKGFNHLESPIALVIHLYRQPDEYRHRRDRDQRQLGSWRSDRWRHYHTGRFRGQERDAGHH
jgi:rifampicin phosphotransferase